MKKIGFSGQILIILLSLVLLSTLMISAFSINLSTKANKKLIMENLQEITEMTYDIVDSSVNTSIRNYLRAIAEKNIDLVKMYYNQVQAGLITKDQAFGLLTEIQDSIQVSQDGYIYLLDSVGTLLNHPQLTGQNIKEFDFVQKQISMKEGYLEYHWQNPSDAEERDKSLYMTYFEPWDIIVSVSAYKSEFLNLVSIEDFRDNIVSRRIGESGYMYVLDSKGDVIIHPYLEGSNQWDIVDPSGKYIVQEIIENKVGTITYMWSNSEDDPLREKITDYIYYEPMDWYICSSVYTDEVNDTLHAFQLHLLVIFLIIILISIFVVLFIIRYIRRPILKLISAMNAIIDGNTEVSLNTDKDDDIGKLAKIFNVMVQTIHRKTEDLKNKNLELNEINQTLEEKVKERTRQLEILSTTDSLTGIYNRRKFETYLFNAFKKALIDQYHLSILLIDIDDFKKYNDNYGHVEGDNCLRSVTAAIKETVKPYSGFCARYGGEEFIVIIKNQDQDQIMEIANQVRSDVEKLQIDHKFTSISPFVTISIGISIFDSDKYPSTDAFIQSADEALYLAKEKGKNTVVLAK